MRAQHPLFGLGPLGDAWDMVGVGPEYPDDYRDGLLRLAVRLDELPAPVYFRVPADVEGDVNWQRILGLSDLQCGCADRRVLVPRQGRARFMPYTTPKYVQITTRETGRAKSPQIAVIPHGGDLAAAHLSLGVCDGWVVCTELPLMQERPEQQSVTFGGALEPGYRDGKMWLSDGLHASIVRRGEIIVYRTLRRGGTRVTFPVCSIVEESSADNRMVVELDASVTSQMLDPLNMPALHVCQA